MTSPHLNMADPQQLPITAQGALLPVCVTCDFLPKDLAKQCGLGSILQTRLINYHGRMDETKQKKKKFQN